VPPLTRRAGRARKVAEEGKESETNERIQQPELSDEFFDNGQVKGGVEGDGFSLDGWRG
jgi:hypothetical protein